ncbi:MAG: winged helix-turn-helix domain-containing protein [Candidatus Omnitrophota bacterium]|nr:MAG: winged helix-turn-helix domain-containing protein [Candidatus Omnitrophota bacterium]
MITELGIVAGDIWHFLDEHGKTAALADLVAGLDKPRDTILMSLGWLAREGHVKLEKEGQDYRIELRK